MIDFMKFLGKKKEYVVTSKPKKGNVVEDITLVRNIQEKMAGLEVGDCFALATREGHHIFKKVKIEPYTTDQLNGAKLGEPKIDPA